jgi:hypothetical protein
VKEKIDYAEMVWKLSHSNFSELLQMMQQLMQLTSESHVNQLLTAHRSVQKEKITRILAEAQLQERDDIQAAHEEAYKLLEQRHRDLRERYIELCSRLNMYASSLFLLMHCAPYLCFLQLCKLPPFADNRASIKKVCIRNIQLQLAQSVGRAIAMH